MRAALDRGAELEARDKHGVNAFLAACQLGHAEIIALLARAGCNTGAKDDDGARLGLKVGSEVHRTTAETVIMVARSRTITGAPQPPPFFETNELQSLENVR